MSSPRLPFRLEYQRPGGEWVSNPGDQDASKLYLQGIADEYSRSRSPRLAVRLVRDRDGKVLREYPASAEPQIGVVAGWPASEQCIRAAIKVLEQGARPMRGYGTADEVDRCRRALEVLRG